jgi:hypothetical protein
MKPLILILAFCFAVLTTQGQNNVAYQLMTKEWTQEQEAVMLEAIDRPSKALEPQVLTAFDLKDARKVFGSPVKKNANYEHVKSLDTVRDKNLFLNSLTDQEWASVWRVHFSTYFKDATRKQRDFLIRFGRSLGNKEIAKGFATEGLKLFGKEPFVTIGHYTSFGVCPNNSRGKLSAGNCYCSVGSSFNMQCSNDCSTSQGNGCTTTDGTCGFLGLYNCDGGCSRDEESLYAPREGVGIANA